MKAKNPKIAIVSSLFAFVLWGCGGGGGQGSEQPVTIRFAAKVGSEVARCGGSYSGLGRKQTSATLNDLRFYVSRVRLLDSAGVEHPVELEQDGVWQYQNVALLDFEDGTAGCSEQGTAETNAVIRGRVAAKEYSGLRFEIGIPFDLNHLDPVTSPSPLNINALGWMWQVGHIFYRTDLSTPSGPYFMHLGSTGCDSSGAASPPSAICDSPNLPTITLTGFRPETHIVTLDLASLLQGVDLTQSTPGTAPGCMSEINDGECAQLFPNYGLSLQTGRCVEDCRNQTAFSVE